jgi:hypothetical protein
LFPWATARRTCARLATWTSGHGLATGNTWPRGALDFAIIYSICRRCFIAVECVNDLIRNKF